MRAAEAAAWGGLFLFGVVVALLGAVLPVLSEPLGIDLATAGGLFATLNAVVLAGSTAFGLAVDRFGCRSALTGGSLLVAAGLTAVAAAETALALGAALVALGLGGSALNSASNAIGADMFTEPRARAAALNRIGVAFGLGALALPLLIGGLLDRIGLAGLLHALAALAVVVAVYSALVRLPPAKQADVLRPREALDLMRQPLFVALGGLLVIQAGTEMLLAGYLSTFMIEETGAGVRAASTVLAASWAGFTLSRLLLGILLFRVTAAAVLPWLAAASAATVALVPFATGIAGATVLFVTTAFLYSGIIPIVLAIGGSAAPGRTGSVMGMMISLAVFGAMTLPWATGHLAAAVGVRVVPLVAIAGLSLVTLLAVVARRLDARRPAEAAARQA